MLRLSLKKDGKLTLDGKMMDYLIKVAPFEFEHIAGNLFRKDGYLEDELYLTQV